MSISKEIPDIITDYNSVKLIKEQYLGKGGSGRCYALKCSNTGKLYAGKFLDKSDIEKYNVTNKIIQEINIHKTLNHENIVSFKSCIQDQNFIYIILELCANRSMSELIKRRRFIKTFEAKYYMKQVVSGISYLHENNIIHRDLKLANLFINHHMVIKVGDFGLAVKVSKEKATRRSLCGTPNYIAPEVLSRQGHSYEVDIWALGCILYTLLVGTPPFQKETIEETYDLIAKCHYNIPEPLCSSTAADFITCTLQKDPNLRPTIFELSNHDFLHVGFIPKRLPSSCILMPPRAKTLLQYSSRQKKYFERSPLSDINLPVNQSRSKLTDIQLTNMLKKMFNNVNSILTAGLKNNNSDDTQNPSLCPFIWVNSWMDYSHKYGFGYRLNDNTVGALFNDNTTILVMPSGKNAHYFQNDGYELYLNTDETNEKKLSKKIKILNSFRNFMFDSLRNAYDPDDEPLSSLPILKNWVNAENIVGMFLSNGTLQLNFLLDHIKLILCPVMDAITVIGYGNQMTTYQLDLLKIYGCNELLLNKLLNAVSIIKIILNERKQNQQAEKNPENDFVE